MSDSSSLTSQIISSIVLMGSDALSIPEAMSVPYTTMKSIVYGLIPLFFAGAALTNVLHTITKSGESHLKVMLKRLVLLLIGLQLYDFIFLKVIALSDVIAMAMGESSKISDLMSFTRDSATKLMADAGGGEGLKWAVTIVATLKQVLSPKVWVLSLLDLTVLIGEPILLLIRYSLLCILYVFGPLAFLFSFFSATRKMLSGWFTNLIQISFWIVTLKVLQTIIVSLNIQSMATSRGSDIDIIPWILVMALFVVFLILTPVITSKIFSGENLGAVGSMAMGMIAAAATAGAAGTGPLGKIIGHAAGKGSSAGGEAETVTATGLHAVAEKTGDVAKAGFQKIGGATKRFGERIRAARKERPRR